MATVFGGKVTAHQKTKPLPGKEQREVRVGALIADIFTVLAWVLLLILLQEQFTNQKNNLL